MKRKGFTLIELLIVIALLGALAVGLLAAIDPLEQFRKVTDTSVRSIASELHDGIIRSYSSLSKMPWDNDPNSAEDVANTANNLKTNVIQPVVNTGELKSGFAELAGDGKLQKIWVAGQDGGTSSSPRDPKVIVCFKPESKSIKCDVNTKYTINSSATGINSVVLDTSTCNTTNCGNVNYKCWWCIGDVPTASTP